MTPFEAVNGLRFWHRAEVHTICSATYSNGRAALGYRCPTEPAVVKISVNVPEAELGPDEFFVKWSGDEGALARADMHVVHRLGLFEDAGRRVSTGFVEDYAAAWTFKRCWWTKHRGKDGFRVLCPDCRADFEKAVVKHEEERDAREALGRFETLQKMERGQTPTSRAAGRFAVTSLLKPRKR